MCCPDPCPCDAALPARPVGRSYAALAIRGHVARARALEADERLRRRSQHAADSVGRVVPSAAALDLGVLVETNQALAAFLHATVHARVAAGPGERAARLVAAFAPGDPPQSIEHSLFLCLLLVLLELPLVELRSLFRKQLLLLEHSLSLRQELMPLRSGVFHERDLSTPKLCVLSCQEQFHLLQGRLLSANDLLLLPESLMHTHHPLMLSVDLLLVHMLLECALGRWCRRPAAAREQHLQGVRRELSKLDPGLQILGLGSAWGVVEASAGREKEVASRPSVLLGEFRCVENANARECRGDT